MTHQRVAIREGARALLAGDTAIGAAGITVYKSRHIPVRPDKLPAIVLSIDGEETTATESAPRIIERSTNLMVEVIAKGAADTDPTLSTIADTLDNYCALVESAIGSDESLGGNVWDTVTAKTDLNFEEDGDQIVAVAQMSFAVRYTTTVQAESDGLDDFDKATINYDLNGEQATADQSQDTLTNIHE